MVFTRTIFAGLLILGSVLYSQTPPDSIKSTSLHFQHTVVDQWHPAFQSAYDGLNSVVANRENAVSVTSTLFLGANIFSNTEIYFNPELIGGTGIGGTHGVAGFPNGEIYRVDDPSPQISLARLFIRQTFNIGSDKIFLEDSQNQIASFKGTKRIVLTAGKFSVSDVFDNNSYSHDPRNQFLNWSIMSSAAWDYPADTRGYTWGFSLEYICNEYALRGAAVMVAEEVNGMVLDPKIKNAFGIVLEFERKFVIGNSNGAIRFLVFNNKARMGKYADALNNSNNNVDIDKTRMYGRNKTGFALNAEISPQNNFGLFLKLSWNDGRNESWMFTEVDHSLTLGGVVRNLKLINDSDEIGAAIAVNGISDDHKNFLQKGGYGFILGDGNLNYGLETIFEAYWKFELLPNFYLSPDYQFILNPAYNIDRGPINLFGVRLHYEK